MHEELGGVVWVAPRLFYSVVVYKPRMPYINIVKKVRWEVTQLCAVFGKKIVLVGLVEDSRVGGWVV